MPHRTNLIPGDGARPEITQTTVRVLEATGVQYNWDVKQASIGGVEGYGSVAQISELYEQGRAARISEDFDLPLKIMGGRSNRPCAETHSRERQ